MKSTKKLVAVLLAVVMVLALSVTAFAADPGVDDNEAKILAKLAELAKANGVSLDNAIYQSVVAQVKTGLQAGELTEAQVNAVVANAETAAETFISTVKSKGFTVAELSTAAAGTLTTAAKTAVTSALAAAANAVAPKVEETGLYIKASVSASGVFAATIAQAEVDENGNVLKNEDGTVKTKTLVTISVDPAKAATAPQTGSDYTVAIVTGAIFVISLGACAVVAQKKNLFAPAAA